MRAGLSRAEIDALPEAHRTALLNGIAARVGLVALLGNAEGARLWQEGDSELRRLLPPIVAASDSHRSMLVGLPPGFRPDLWEIHGESAIFIPAVGNPETVSLFLDEEPEEDVRYVLVAITPSYDWGEARGWITGRDFRRRRVQ
jgi:hypothetical protein